MHRMNSVNLIFMVPYILVIKVLLKFQLDVFYLFICRLYMFRATPIFRSFKCTLQTIGVCTSFDVLLHWIGYWLGHPRTSVTVRFKIHLVGISIKPLLPRCMEPRISKVSHVGCIQNFVLPLIISLLSSAPLVNVVWL